MDAAEAVPDEVNGTKQSPPRTQLMTLFQPELSNGNIENTNGNIEPPNRNNMGQRLQTAIKTMQ